MEIWALLRHPLQGLAEPQVGFAVVVFFLQGENGVDSRHGVASMRCWLGSLVVPGNAL